MRVYSHFWSALLLLAGPVASAQVVGQQSQPDSLATPGAAVPTEAPRRLLLKIGVNAGRALHWGGYEGYRLTLPVTVGAEYALGTNFTAYGQLHTDFRVTPTSALSDRQRYAIPGGGVGVGIRYYYNQAGRARQNRPHGLFQGNYVALEAQTELRRRYYGPDEYLPGLGLQWGMQRRLSRSFLLDLNAGIGLETVRSAYYSGGAWRPNFAYQFNLGLYFGR